MSSEKRPQRNYSGIFRFPAVRIALVVVAILVAVLVLNPFVIINPTEVGLRLRLGALSDDYLEPGVHFKMPFFDIIKKVSIQPLQLDYLINVDAEGAITKDNQTIGAMITVFYRYNPDEIISMYKNYGEIKIENIVLTTVKESVKSTIGQYTIFMLPTAQEEVRTAALNDIRKKLSGYPIEIVELKITNYDWSAEFDQQIQTTMQKAQEVKQKEQELLITELEAQKKVKEAEADKQALITRAEGDKESARLKAEAKVLEGEGLRKYNESIRSNYDIEVKFRQLEIEMERIRKWDGRYVPNNNYMPVPYNYGKIQGE
jgi:regulator of protease activity HflC (stomatin/prohibitin superfamily)